MQLIDSQTALFVFIRNREIEITTREESEEVVAGVAVKRETRGTKAVNEKDTAQDQDTKTTAKARDAIEEVSHLLQVIGVPTSAGGTKRKAENAEMIVGQDLGLNLT